MNSNNSVSRHGPIANTLSRNTMYALLARGFRYPEDGAFTHFSDGEFARAINEALKICAPGLLDSYEAKYAAGLTVASSIDLLISAYLNAFETNLPEPSVSLYEGSYHRQGNRPALLIELKGFYSAFGLAVAESDNELEDGITAELEFMQFLSAKQAQAEDEGLDRKAYLHAQRDFLERHLATWLPALQAEVLAKLKHPFYSALTILTTDFVARDWAYVRQEAAELGL